MDEPLMVIQPPVKKYNYYYSRIINSRKHLIKLHIPLCILKQSILLSNNQGYLLDIRVPLGDFAMETIQKMEDICIQELIQHNTKWFKNHLEEEKIRGFFDSCIRDDTLRIYASNLRSTVSENEQSVSEWLHSIRKQIPKQVSLTIICDGMFIYANKFCLRWIVREIKEYQEPEDILPDTEDIVHFWKEKAHTFIESLQQQKQIWGKKIELLEKRIETVEETVERISQSSSLPILEKEIERLKEAMKVMEEKTFL